jgi:hypothetical protein
MNLRQLDSDLGLFEEQILIASLSLADPDSKQRLISITVITAGIDTARISAGSGEIPAYAFKLLDKYMLERGFKRYCWERRLRNGKIKQVIRKIKIVK